MTKNELRNLLNKKGFPSIYGWAKANKFDTNYVQSVVTRWLKKPATTRRPPIGNVLEILQGLSNTIGMPIHPTVKVKRKNTTINMG